MEIKELQQYLSKEFQGRDSFLETIVYPIFGENNFIEGYDKDCLEADEQIEMAKRTGLKKVILYGSVYVGPTSISIFDVTVEDKVKMKQNRVSIQQLIRRMMDNYSSAFIIFHYDNSDAWDWRFSYCQKDDKEVTEAKRYTFILGKGQSCRTAAENFYKLMDKNDELTREDIVKAFDVEALNKEFFKKYKGQYVKFYRYIIDNKTNKELFGEDFSQCDDKQIRDYVKKMLGRLVFLQFLTKRGWAPDLKEAFNKHPELQDNFLDAYLEPLFGGVLNTKKSERESSFKDVQHVKRGWNVKLLDEWSNVPFLNGGLFEEDIQDPPHSKLPAHFFVNPNVVPTVDNAFNDTVHKAEYEKICNLKLDTEKYLGVFDFFEQYNFTIDENDPNDAEVGVDPEMLGAIFENLLEDNKDKGAFYTPKEIVQYMCKESLIAYLQTDAKDDAHKERIRNFIIKHDASALKNPQYVKDKLLKVKICDPAIGSGAFPMGLLNELVWCFEALNVELQDITSRATLKKHIIQNSIYGVDIEKGAVDIARLRFWLSILVDEELEEGHTDPTPLPNLDFKIMQGNSLLEQFDGLDLSELKQKAKSGGDTRPKRNLFGEIEDSQLSISFEEGQSTNLSEMLAKYFSCEDHTVKYQLKENINTTVIEILKYNIGLKIEIERDIIIQNTAVEKKIENKIENHLEHKKNTTDKQSIANLDAELKKLDKKLKTIENTIAKANAEIDRLQGVQEKLSQMNVSANDQFFLWHTWFGDVFERGGFDIVIGNPPYVEAKKLRNIASTLKPIYTVYSGTADLSIYFQELALNLSRVNGITSFITTNKFFNTGYGRPVRRLLVNNTISQVLDFEQCEVFEGILVSTVVINVLKHVFDNDSHEFVYQKYYQLNSKQFKEIFMERKIDGKYPQRYLSEEEWSFSDERALNLKALIENGKSRIGDIPTIHVNRGVTTGYNPAFIITNEQKKTLIEKDDRNVSIIKKMLQGRNIRKWYYNESDENLLQTGYDINIKDDYPSIYSHLDTFNSQLSSRSDQGRNWWNLRACNYYSEFERDEKIIWGLTADKWAYTLDTEKHYLPSNGYIMTSDEIPTKFLLGIINSKVLHCYFHFIGVMTAGGAYTLKAATIEALPIPMVDYNKQQPIITLVDNILSAKKANPQADISKEENEIDNIVYKLYGLGPDEIALIESSVK